MTSITLDFADDQLNRYRAKAMARGITVEEWFLQAAAKEEAEPETASLQDASFEEWERAFNEWIASHDPDTPVLPPEAMRRENIYPDRSQGQCWSIAMSSYAPCSRTAPTTILQKTLSAS